MVSQGCNDGWGLMHSPAQMTRVAQGTGVGCKSLSSPCHRDASRFNHKGELSPINPRFFALLIISLTQGVQMISERKKKKEFVPSLRYQYSV